MLKYLPPRMLARYHWIFSHFPGGKSLDLSLKTAFSMKIMARIALLLNGLP